MTDQAHHTALGEWIPNFDAATGLLPLAGVAVGGTSGALVGWPLAIAGLASLGFAWAYPRLQALGDTDDLFEMMEIDLNKKKATPWDGLDRKPCIGCPA